jgi:hypothetical protein
MVKKVHWKQSDHGLVAEKEEKIFEGKAEGNLYENLRYICVLFRKDWKENVEIECYENKLEGYA